MIFSCHGKPLIVSSAVHVSGRPMWRWMPYTSAWVTFSPGRSAATPFPASRSGSSSAVSSADAGDARRHRATLVAVVRGRRRRREAGGARRQRFGDHLLHAADLVVGCLALVAVGPHHVEPHRGVADVARVVEQRARAARSRRSTAGTSRSPATGRPRTACRATCPRRAATCARAARGARAAPVRSRTRSCRRRRS